MSKMNKLLLIAVAVFGSFLLSCNNNQNQDDPIPLVAVDKYINVTFPGYINLQIPGGWVVEPGGVKGLFIMKNFTSEYLCFDLNCSYHPLDACSKLTVDSSGLFFKCGKYDSSVWKPCCGSEFSYDGIPAKAPATRVLRKYNCTFDGTLLHIFN